MCPLSKQHSNKQREAEINRIFKTWGDASFQLNNKYIKSNIYQICQHDLKTRTR